MDEAPFSSVDGFFSFLVFPLELSPSVSSRVLILLYDTGIYVHITVHYKV